MGLFGKCCCCTLKSGCVVLGCLTLFGALIGIGSSIREIKGINTAESIMDNIRKEYGVKNINELNIPGLSEGDVPENIEYFNKTKDARMVQNVLYIIICILYIPASICLLLGANKASDKLVLVFLVVDGANILLIFVKLALVFGMSGFDPELLGASILGAGIATLIWLFPFSLWQDIKAGNDGTTC